MSEYQLEIKQIVDYPRCRIYRQFIQMLLAEKNIRISGTSGLFYYTVLCCYANFRTSYKRVDGISYTINPGEWLCSINEVKEWFRTRFQHQAITILDELQRRNLISYHILGHGKLIKFKINDWCRHNRVLDYNAPCQKDSGFFFLPISIANELISSGKCSEMDALLDMWINTVYNDIQVQGSESGPVVYIRNGSGNPLVGYSELATRWGISKATVGRYLKKLNGLEFIKTIAFKGTHGTVIYLQRYLSTMFEISDVLVDKDEIAMALNIKADTNEIVKSDTMPEISVSENLNTVSKSHITNVICKIAKILEAQGFSCCNCHKVKYKLLPLSADCKGLNILPNDRVDGFQLVMTCGYEKELFRFEIKICEGEL